MFSAVPTCTKVKCCVGTAKYFRFGVLSLLYPDDQVSACSEKWIYRYR